MATLQAWLQTTTGFLVALGALIAAISGLIAALAKLFATRSRLAKLEKASAEQARTNALVKRRLDLISNRVKTDNAVESVRTSLLPEHADAAELEELKARVGEIDAKYTAEMHALSLSFREIHTTLGHLLTGKLKIQ